MTDGVGQARGSFWSSVATLFATSGTLVCCAIPAALVTLGAGAALSSLVSVFPQVVWLSEHKEALFDALRAKRADHAVDGGLHALRRDCGHRSGNQDDGRDG